MTEHQTVDSESELIVVNKDNESDYQIIREIKKLPEANLYEISFPNISNHLCLKETLIQLKNAKRIKIFEHEAEILKSLNHPNIIKYIYHSTTKREHDFQVKLFLEYTERGSLSTAIQENISIDILSVLQSIAKALKFVHSKRIIHRDIKPENILITRDGLMKISGFDISAEIHNLSENVGTPGYMAPEIWRKDPYDEKVDIFSLGITIYQLVEKKLPYKGNDPIIKKVTFTNKNFEKKYQQLVTRMLDKNPQKRPSAEKL